MLPLPEPLPPPGVTETAPNVWTAAARLARTARPAARARRKEGKVIGQALRFQAMRNLALSTVSTVRVGPLLDEATTMPLRMGTAWPISKTPVDRVGTWMLTSGSAPLAGRLVASKICSQRVLAEWLVMSAENSQPG